MKPPAASRLIAVNEIFGAVLVVAAQAVALVQGLVALPFGYVLAALSTAVVAALAGVRLFLGRRDGWRLSLLLQALQVIGIVTPSFHARLELGVKVTLEFTHRSLMTHSGFGGLFDLWPWSGAAATTLVLNPLALAALLYLLYHPIPAATTPDLEPGLDARAA